MWDVTERMQLKERKCFKKCVFIQNNSDNKNSNFLPVKQLVEVVSEWIRSVERDNLFFCNTAQTRLFVGSGKSKLTNKKIWKAHT